MELVFAAFLGVLQGLTEFLPISSSAHLILVPWLLGVRPEGLVFDVSLHVGTALAVLAFFWRDWVRMAVEVVRGLFEGNPLGNADRRLAWLLVVATVPAGVLGFLLDDYVEFALRSPLVTVVTLILFALVLLAAERGSRRDRNIRAFNWADSIWIGLSQAVALIPGVSRSGITISAALFRDAGRASAARFSFLLSTPVIVGAGVLEGWRFYKSLSDPALSASLYPAAASGPHWTILIVGTACAAATGFLCIRYFLRYLRSNSFLPFVLYRIALAVLVLVFYFKG